MRAIVVEAVGGPEVLKLKMVADPVPAPDQIAVRIVMTGVNFAETLRNRGAYGDPPPYTPGIDGVGRIVALGANVKGFAIGQRVACYPDTGAYAEIALSAPALTYALPDAVSDEAAAALNILVTAHNVVNLAGRVQPGESVLVHAAAGGVGSLALQLARLAGAKTLFATVGSPDKFAHAQNAGADVVINYRTQDFGEEITKATGGKGVDVILDSVAGPVVRKGLAVLAPFGRYVSYGKASGESAALSLDDIDRNNRAIIGYTSGGFRRLRPEGLRQAAERSLQLVAEGKLKLDIGARFPLERVADAHRLVESRTSHGKILIEVA
jgi:NADPH2:quinone reductase